MPSEPRIYFVSSLLFLTLVIVLTASTFGYTQAESPPIVEYASGNSSAAHSALPQDQSLTPLAFVTVTFQGATLGEMIVYDDAKTERFGDFAAMFSTAGHLLGATWFDRFGIQRTAVDRGLLEEADELEGVFVVILEGDAL